MSKDDAIEWVKAAMIDFARDDERSDEILTARDMAIAALEQDKLWASQETVLDQLNQSINILEATDRIKAFPPLKGG